MKQKGIPKAKRKRNRTWKAKKDTNNNWPSSVGGLLNKIYVGPAWAAGRFDVKAWWAEKGNEKGDKTDAHIYTKRETKRDTRRDTRDTKRDTKRTRNK